MRTLLLILTACLAAAVLPGCQGVEKGRPESVPAIDVRKPIRGLFVTRWDIRSAADADRIAENAASIGTTDLFVQVRGAGDVMYESVEPFVSHIGSTPRPADALGAVVRSARARGMRVHAWFNVLTLAPREQPMGEVDRDIALMHQGEPVTSPDGYLLMEPGSDVAKERIGRLVEDAIRAQEFDGVCLDYLRLPPEVADAERRAALDELTTELSGRIRTADADLFVSVICPATPAAAMATGQQPGQWLTEGAVDAVVAVSPSDLADAPRRNLAAWQESLPKGSTLIAALSPADALTPQVLLEQWRSVRTALGPRAHVAWFTYAGLFESGDPGQAGDMRSTGFRTARRESLIDALGPKVSGKKPAAEAQPQSAAPAESDDAPPATLDPLDAPVAPEPEVEPGSEGATAEESEPGGVIDEHQRR